MCYGRQILMSYKKIFTLLALLLTLALAAPR